MAKSKQKIKPLKNNANHIESTVSIDFELIVDVYTDNIPTFDPDKDVIDVQNQIENAERSEEVIDAFNDFLHIYLSKIKQEIQEAGYSDIKIHTSTPIIASECFYNDMMPASETIIPADKFVISEEELAEFFDEFEEEEEEIKEIEEELDDEEEID